MKRYKKQKSTLHLHKPPYRTANIWKPPQICKITLKKEEKKIMSNHK